MITNLISQFAVTCTNGSASNFFKFPTWYKYLKIDPDCSPRVSGLSDIWLILAAVIDILVRLGALLAVGFIIYGGFSYVTSQGEPDKTNKARSTIINALIGLVLSVIAAGVVSFVAGSIK